LFIGPLPTFPENFMQTVGKFLRKIANRQKTNNKPETVSIAEPLQNRQHAQNP